MEQGSERPGYLEGYGISLTHSEAATGGAGLLEKVVWSGSTGCRHDEGRPGVSTSRDAVNLGYNKRLRPARSFPLGLRGRKLCLPISSCPRWESPSLRGPLPRG